MQRLLDEEPCFEFIFPTFMQFNEYPNPSTNLQFTTEMSNIPSEKDLRIQDPILSNILDDVVTWQQEIADNNTQFSHRKDTLDSHSTSSEEPVDEIKKKLKSLETEKSNENIAITQTENTFENNPQLLVDYHQQHSQPTNNQTESQVIQSMTLQETNPQPCPSYTEAMYKRIWNASNQSQPLCMIPGGFLTNLQCFSSDFQRTTTQIQPNLQNYSRQLPQYEPPHCQFSPRLPPFSQFFDKSNSTTNSVLTALLSDQTQPNQQEQLAKQQNPILYAMLTQPRQQEVSVHRTTQMRSKWPLQTPKTRINRRSPYQQQREIADFKPQGITSELLKHEMHNSSEQQAEHSLQSQTGYDLLSLEAENSENSKTQQNDILKNIEESSQKKNMSLLEKLLRS